jgi:hypothetical protein
MAWEYRVLRGMFDDELGPLARDYVGSAQSWVALEERDGRSDLALVGRCDHPGDRDGQAGDRRGDGRGWCRAAGSIRRSECVDLGPMHTATFEEPTLGSSGIGPLEWYFDAGPLAVDGADGAIDASYYRLRRGYPDPEDPDFTPLGMDGLFTVTNLPSYRLLMDMSDIDGGADRDHDRPVGHAVRPPLHRPDRAVAGGLHATAPFTPARRQGRDGR